MNEIKDIFITIEPRDALITGVIFRIKKIEKRRATTKVILSSACCFGAVTISVFLIGDITKEMYSSGFTEYVGLIFSNSQSVMNNFEQFSLALVESLPEVLTALALSTLFVLFFSIKIFSKNFPRIRSSVRQTTLTA